tara:strand:- start:21 stop:695 length:675 start_codon:yes stop_codon:yes gene_type:complete
MLVIKKMSSELKRAIVNLERKKKKKLVRLRQAYNGILSGGRDPGSVIKIGEDWPRPGEIQALQRRKDTINWKATCTALKKQNSLLKKENTRLKKELNSMKSRKDVNCKQKLDMIQHKLTKIEDQHKKDEEQHKKECRDEQEMILREYRTYFDSMHGHLTNDIEKTNEERRKLHEQNDHLQINIKKCEMTVQELEKRQEHQRNIWLEAIRKSKEANKQEKQYDMI